MPNFRKGSAGIKQGAQARGGKFTPTIRFEANSTKYLQFLTPLDDVVTVLMHPYVQVDQKEDGTYIPAMFISRRDPALDGTEGYDPLIDRFGLQPSYKSIALAVELEAVDAKKKIFEVATRQYETRDGDVKTVPNVGLVIQSPSNFFSHLDAINDVDAITDSVFAVKRTGKTRDTTYTFIQAGKALASDELEGLDDFLAEFDFDAHLEELADEARMKQLIDPLPDGWEVNKFAAKDKKNNRSGSSRTRRQPVVEDEAEAGDEEGGEKAPPVSRARKFAAMREQMQSDDNPDE